MGRLGRHRILSLNLGLMVAGMLATAVPWLPAVVGGVALVTFGFFGAHSVSSAWVALRAREGKAQASALYLVFYYAGSSVAGTSGGLFWARLGWPGVVGFVVALLAIALWIARILAERDPDESIGEAVPSVQGV
jgi:YNFM family putative membrane transporter